VIHIAPTPEKTVLSPAFYRAYSYYLNFIDEEIKIRKFGNFTKVKQVTILAVSWSVVALLQSLLSSFTCLCLHDSSLFKDTNHIGLTAQSSPI
jgi:hypothetical protein